jgi:hypothetical protein
MFDQLKKAFEREFIGKQKNEWCPASDSIYHGVMTDEELEQMQKRNEAAIKKCTKTMGKKWILHPSHKVTRL